MGALDLFTSFRQEGREIAIAVDEYGGVAGLVTMVDLADAILRALATEGRQGHSEIRRREVGHYLVGACLAIDELCDTLKLPREDIETVAGLILDRFDKIPSTGDVINWGDWKSSTGTATASTRRSRASCPRIQASTNRR